MASVARPGWVQSVAATNPRLTASPASVLRGRCSLSLRQSFQVGSIALDGHEQRASGDAGFALGDVLSGRGQQSSSEPGSGQLTAPGGPATAAPVGVALQDPPAHTSV